MVWRSNHSPVMHWAEADDGGKWLISQFAKNGDPGYKLQKKMGYNWLDFGVFCSYREAVKHAEQIKDRKLSINWESRVRRVGEGNV